MLMLKEDVVRKMIQDTGLSVRSWALSHGFQQGTLAGWITGRRNIKIDNLNKLASALGTTPKEIARVTIKINGDDTETLKRDRSIINGIFGWLDKDQRKKIIDIAQRQADINVDQAEFMIGKKEI